MSCWQLSPQDEGTGAARHPAALARRAIAERIRSLEYPAPGSQAQFGKPGSLGDAQTAPPKALDMVCIHVTGHAAVARAGCSVFPLVDKANDEPTADPLMQRWAVRGQTAWILLSLLE